MLGEKFPRNIHEEVILKKNNNAQNLHSVKFALFYVGKNPVFSYSAIHIFFLFLLHIEDECSHSQLYLCFHLIFICHSVQRPTHSSLATVVDATITMWCHMPQISRLTYFPVRIKQEKKSAHHAHWYYNYENVGFLDCVWRRKLLVINEYVVVDGAGMFGRRYRRIHRQSICFTPTI